MGWVLVERLCVIAIDELAASRDDGSVERTHCELLDALTLFCPFTEVVRYGVFVLPVRAPRRFLGGESAVYDNCRAIVQRTVGLVPRLGVADGLFSALAAAQRETVVPPGESTSFRRSLPIDDLLDPPMSTTAHRLGLHDIGLFADLDVARVTERFSRHVVERHRVARGERDVWDDERDSVLLTRMLQARGGEAVVDGQQSFFGQRSDADRRDQIASCGSRGRLSAGRQEQGPLGAWNGCRGIAASGERPGSTPGHSARPPEGYATGGRPQRLRYTRAAGCRSFREKTLPWSCPSAMSSCRKMRFSRSLEGKRMASGHTGNVVPGNRLWVRVPCPPLVEAGVDRAAGCPRITV